MNILMVNVPFSGHVNPTLPLAKELVSRGHNVSYILTNEWKERIEATGAKFIPYNGNANFKIEFKNGKPTHLLHAIKAWKYAYQTIVSVGKEYDLLIYEFFTFVAFAAANKIGIKVIRQFSTFAINNENINSILVSNNKEIKLLNNKIFLKLITKLICGRIKLATSDIISEIVSVPVELNIVYTVREFQSDSTSFDDSYIFVGPSIEERRRETDIPYDRMQNIIYISMGTLQNDRLNFYKKCMQAFGNKEGISVIMSIGNNIQCQELGDVPENFYIYSFVNQLEVLKHSKIFISHGGMNSINEGLYYENRFLVIPMDMDQYAVAKRIQELNLGYLLNKSDVTPELLWMKVKALLENTDMEQNIKNMSKTMQASKGARTAADCIEEYCNKN